LIALDTLLITVRAHWVPALVDVIAYILLSFGAILTEFFCKGHLSRASFE